jgi:dolichol kinase
MKREMMRQFVHLSGLVFVYISQFIDKNVSAFYFLLIAMSFLIYSWYVRRQMTRAERIMDLLEGKLRKFVMKFDRKDIPRPFIGPFWFYMGFFLAYFLFPLEIAIASCAILSVGDAMSTVIGKAFGKREYLPKKTVEGSLAFFFSSFLVLLLILPLRIALIGALVGTLVEPLPALRHFRRLSKRDLLDDNLLIPLLSGLAMLLLVTKPF